MSTSNARAVMEITGVDADMADALLEVSHQDVDRAVALHFDGGGAGLLGTGGGGGGANQPPASTNYGEPSDIGAVTPQMAGNLATGGFPTDDYGSGIPPDMLAQMMGLVGGNNGASGGMHRGASSGGLPSTYQAPPPRPKPNSERIPRKVQSSNFRSSTSNTEGTSVATLLRAPQWLMTTTLRDACTQAAQEEKWVLVNIVDDEFESACMNRDIWHNETIRNLVECYYVVLQLSQRSNEASQLISRYQTFERGCTVPFVLILHPYTKMERKMILNTEILPPKEMSRAADPRAHAARYSQNMLDLLWSFYDKFGTPQPPGAVSSSSTAPEPVPAVADRETFTASTNANTDAIDFEDDPELAAALALSAAEGGGGGGSYDTAIPVDEDVASRAVSEARQDPPPPPSRPEVDLTEDLAQAENAPDDACFRLRVKMPTGAPWSIRVLKALRAQRLADAIRTMLSKQQQGEAPAAASTERMNWLVGFPPKRCFEEAESMADRDADPRTLADLAPMRSGDVITPQL